MFSVTITYFQFVCFISTSHHFCGLNLVGYLPLLKNISREWSLFFFFLGYVCFETTDTAQILTTRYFVLSCYVVLSICFSYWTYWVPMSLSWHANPRCLFQLNGRDRISSDLHFVQLHEDSKFGRCFPSWFRLFLLKSEMSIYFTWTPKNLAKQLDLKLLSLSCVNGKSQKSLHASNATLGTNCTE